MRRGVGVVILCLDPEVISKGEDLVRFQISKFLFRDIWQDLPNDFSSLTIVIHAHYRPFHH